MSATGYVLEGCDFPRVENTQLRNTWPGYVPAALRDAKSRIRLTMDVGRIADMYRDPVLAGAFGPV